MPMMILEPRKPDIDINKLLSVFGCRSEDKLSYSTGRSLNSLASTLQDITRPKIVYRMIPIDSCDTSLRLAGDLEIKSAKAAKLFDGCTHVCCFLATIGKQIDEEIMRLADHRRSADAYILDTIGSSAIEDIVERFHTNAKKRMRSEGKAVTLRMSPGYCDWPLQEQGKLFSLLDAGTIGVELTDSCLMIPRKTVSGMFGVADVHTSITRQGYNPCSECTKKNCKERRAAVTDNRNASTG